METLIRDLRYAVRALRRTPGFTIVAVLTLVIGVGATTAIFSVVNAVLVRALPFRDPDRLVRITFDNPGLALHDVPFSFPEFDDLRSRAGVFDEVSVVFPASVNLTGASQPERLELLGVSPNYFSMLGERPQLGRLFGAEDIARGFAPVAVISDGLWRRSYGADPRVLGRTLRLDNDPYTIVGVTAPRFRHPGPTVTRDVDIWVTAGFSADPFPNARGARLLPGAIGRFGPDLTLAQAQKKLDVFASDVRRDYPSDYPSAARWSVAIQPLQQALVANVRTMLLVLMAAVIAIVAIACVNIANLQLARASGRAREMGIRLALGAGRGRLVRQMLTESLLLSLLAGAAGVATAAAGLDALIRLLPRTVPLAGAIRVDANVLASALLLSVGIGLLFGMAPALHAARPGLVGAIREGASGSGYSPTVNRLRQMLIASEFALAVILLVSAGLLLRTFWTLLHENPGFNPARVVAASIWLPVPNDPAADPYIAAPKRTAFVRETLRRIGGIPGVESAAITSDLPIAPAATSAPLVLEGRPIDPAAALTAEVIRVSPAYFPVLQAPLVRGRMFAENDDANGQLVAMIDETTARRYWGNEDPLGRRIKLGGGPAAPWLVIVGIAKDIKHDGLDRDGVPHVYVPIYQRNGRSLSIVVRTTLPVASVESQVRHEVQQVDRDLPVFGVRTMDEVIDRSLAPRRFAAALVGLFALMAILVASIGVYGLLAYTVGQRTRELGLRMALGAQRRDILTLISTNGLLVACVGILFGLAGATVAASLMRTLLYGVRPIDGPVFVTVPMVLLAVTLIASYVPARRAARIDPITALRQE